MRRGGTRRPDLGARVRRRALAGAAAAALHVSAGAAAAGEPVRLDIRNAGAGAELRCVLVLAHFVTLEAGAAAPGEAVRIALARDPADGTLTFTSDDGRSMAVENVLCGAGGNWSETRGDVPILDLRDGTRRALGVDCVLDRRLRCRPATP